MTTLIAQTPSLNLIHEPGSENEPETFTVQVRTRPHVCGSLEVARDFDEIDGEPIGPAEAATVLKWSQAYL